MTKKNPHLGSSFESWLAQEGILGEVAAAVEDIHVLTDEERAAIADARSGGFASDDAMAAFWKRAGVIKG